MTILIFWAYFMSLKNSLFSETDTCWYFYHILPCVNPITMVNLDFKAEFIFTLNHIIIEVGN